MTALTKEQGEALIGRHPNVFSGSLRKTLTIWAIAVGTVLYLAYAWWFFAIGQVFADADWDIAGIYLADWVSYEVRPDVEFEDGYLTMSFPRFSPLGADPHPDWIDEKQAMVERNVETSAPSAADAQGSDSGSGFLGKITTDEPQGFLGTMKGGVDEGAGPAAGKDAPAAAKTVREKHIVSTKITLAAHKTIAIAPGLVTVTRGGETLVLDIDRDKSVTARGTLPDWARQRGEGGKVTVWFGFSGRAEIESDEVKIRNRFPGWENFVFDTRSPFWGESFGTVVSMIVSGPRIRPDMSNLALAWDNIWNNAEWQHGDVWVKLMQTIVMAFAGTVLASLVAFPLAFAAARNITRNKLLNQGLKRFFDFQRSVDMLIWALFFTRGFGPGPLAGISAIFFTDTGTFGKLYSESLENIDDRQREGVRSVGASPTVVQRFGVLPQVLPVFLSQSLYFWESNTRSATIIGAVGAGGIGLKLWEAMRTNQDWENVAYMVILILIVVFVFDNISSALRKRLMGPSTNAQ